MLLKRSTLASRVVAAVTVLVVFSPRALSVQESSPDKSATPVPSQSTQRRAVSALGRLEPAGEVVSVGASSESLLEKLLVKDGDWVEAGQELFRLDSYDERRADRDLAATRLATARDRLATETRLAEQAITDAETELRRVTELDPVEIEAQQARVEVMVTRLANERRNLERKKELGDLVAGGSLEDQQALVDEAEKNLTATRADLRAREVAHEIDLVKARAEIERNRKLLERARVVYATQTPENELARAETRLEASIIRAFRAGQILKTMKTAGERIGLAPVLQLGNTREMHVVAEVYETDISLVRIGQQATIESSAFSGKLRGEVIQIGLLVSKNDILDVDPLADVDTRVVEVLVRLDENEISSRLTNLEVDVDILLESNPPTGK